MKTYWDLSEKERAELTHEDVELFVDCELMRLGVLKVPPLKLEPVEEVKIATRTFYRLCGKGYHDESDLAFPTVAAAQQAAALGAVLVKRDWEAGNLEYASEPDFAVVKSVELADLEQVSAMKLKLRAAACAKSANEEATRKHSEAIAKQSRELETMWSDWRSCRADAEQHRRVAETFEEYKRIAGSPDVAATFLAKAFTAEQIEEARAWLGVHIPSPRDARDPVAAEVA